MKEYVRRDDLILRAKYPSLVTRIFEISYEKFVIFVENPFIPKEELSNEFNYSIRMIVSPVTLTFEIPSDYIYEIKPIADDEIAKNFAGIGITTNQLYNLLASKFSALKKIEIDEVKNGVVKIHLSQILDEQYKNLIKDFLETMSEGFIKFRPIFDLVDDSSRLILTCENSTLTILPSSVNKTKIEYEERDEEFWFDHIDGIYQGTITKDHILGMPSLGNSCYINQLFPNCINIRNGLLLFDRIFMDLPVNESIDEVCRTQQIKKSEAVDLCRKGRLAFITTQPYDRIDSNFLNELFKINPYSVFSRRALSALIIADLVKINKETLFSNELLHLLKKDVLDSLNLPFVTTEKIYDFLTWPKHALRQSLNLFLTESPARISNIGINRCVELPSEVPKSADFNFEFTMHAPFIHIASALDAYYFPSGDKNYNPKLQVSLMYNILNLFKCSSLEGLNRYISKFSMQKRPSIELLEVNSYPSIREIETYSREFCSPQNFNTLFTYLDALSESERSEKILKYNDSLSEFQIKNSKDRRALSLGFSFLSSLVPIPFFGFIIDLLKYGGNAVLEKNNKIQKMIYGMRNTINPGKPMDSQAIRFLSQINPVARLE